jgi:hypothetical protein
MHSREAVPGFCTHHFTSVKYYADLAQPELRDLYELVGTLNIWVSINTPINQSINGLISGVFCSCIYFHVLMTGTLGGGKGMRQGVEWTELTWL